MLVQLDKSSCDIFCELRVALLKELGDIQEQQISQFIIDTKEFYKKNINKTLYTFAIEEKNEIVSIASLCIFERLPYPENSQGKEGYILNVYTRPKYRRKGYAENLLKGIVEFSKKENIKRLWLSSSSQGKKLYLKMGFSEKNMELEKFLD